MDVYVKINVPEMSSEHLFAFCYETLTFTVLHEMVINTNEVIRVKNNQLANGFSIYRMVVSPLVFREYLREFGGRFDAENISKVDHHLLL